MSTSRAAWWVNDECAASRRQRAHHALRTLVSLSLSPAHWCVVLASIYRAANLPVPSTQQLQQLQHMGGDLDTLPWSATARRHLEDALASPSMSAAIADALTQIHGGTASVICAVHPLGDRASFPPRIAQVLGLACCRVEGVPRALPGMVLEGNIVGYQTALEGALPRSAVVLGAGYVGTELALGWAGMGCHVTLVDRHASVLQGFAPVHAATARQMLVDAGVVLALGQQVHHWRQSETGVVVEGRACAVDGRQHTASRQWQADRLVVAVGLVCASHGTAGESMSR